MRTTLSLVALAGLATAQIVKEPLLEDAVRDLPKLFEWILPQPQEYTYDKWTAAEVDRGVPTDGAWSDSIKNVDNWQYCGEDFSVYNVTFADCPEPWIVGHCAKAAMGLDSTINLLARLPSNFRAAISDLIHVYLPPGWGFIAGGGHSLSFAGELGDGWAVELAVRATVFGDGVPIDAFVEAVDQDTCVADKPTADELKNGPGYGNALYRTGMIAALLNMAGTTAPDTKCMSNQLAVIQPVIDARLNAQGQCPNKAVSKLEKLYDILFTDGIEVLNDEPVPGAGAPTVEKWEDGGVPEWCWREAGAQRPGLDQPRCYPKDIQVFNVSYPDCTDQPPWTVCHCTDAQLSLDQMITSFGRLPPALRSYVRHIFAFDGLEGDGQIHTWAGAGDDFVVFFGYCGDSVFMHEAAHCIDRTFHDSDTFKNARQDDSCLPTAYSRTSLAELFAEVSASWIYDHNSRSLADRGFDASCMANQLGVVGDYVGEEYTRSTSQCIPRRPNSPTIYPDLSSQKRDQPYYVSEIVREDFEPPVSNQRMGIASESFNPDSLKLENVRWFE